MANLTLACACSMELRTRMQIMRQLCAGASLQQCKKHKKLQLIFYNRQQVVQIGCRIALHAANLFCDGLWGIN
jgi:hypothetical protein